MPGHKGMKKKKGMTKKAKPMKMKKKRGSYGQEGNQALPELLFLLKDLLVL